MNAPKSVLALVRPMLAAMRQRPVARTFVACGKMQSASRPEAPDAQLYDVVIVGGGAAGCALASVLGSTRALNRLRIALVDPGKLDDTREWKPPTDTYLPRTLQITSRNKRYLERHGVWGQCYTDRVQPCNRAVVTDAVGRGMIDLDASPSLLSVNSGSMAYMIETKNLVSGLLRSIHCSSTPVDLFERAKVVQIEPGHSGIKWPLLTLSNKQSLRARLLIGADGGSSQVRKFAGISTYGNDYGQHGLVATLCLEQLNSAAFQRFLPTGPIAMLPFPGGFANLVWSMDQDRVQQLKALSDDTFVSLVNAAFRLSPAEMQHLFGMVHNGCPDRAIKAETDWRLGMHGNIGGDRQLLLAPAVAAMSPKSRMSFPLRMRVVDSLVAERVALVGDSGHVMHPLAGQGLNMGLEDVQCLAAVLEQAVLAGQDIGTQPVLQRYNSQRYVRNLAMQGVVDKIWHVFSSDAAPIASVRSLAMCGLDSLPAVKRLLVRQMMA
ncbi:putative ubiquinone biosynthesis monooxygenase [Kickxella alabastrina]|uniref:Ubiquinone biosynthesis monooxygenase n=1 Tax=Kickxella alabastrina TaxID=61397 RepID=A0ACC1I946_9FUNG|nr:putative ubiquinone biosynthesis monooxygenase [Kickxella alabastrina]